jgi:hypothetical protein
LSGSTPVAASSAKKSTLLAPQRHIDLAGRLEPPGGEVLLDDVVGRPREDVVGAHEKQPPPATAGGREEPVDGGQDLLRGHRAAVNDLWRALVALVLHRVEEEPVELLADGNHRLAARARPAAEERRRPLLLDEPPGPPGKQVGRPRLRVGGSGLERPAEHAAGGVDLLDGEDLGVAERRLADGEGAGLGVEETEHDRSPGRGQPRRAADEEGRREPTGGGERGGSAGPEPLPAGHVPCLAHRTVVRPWPAAHSWFIRWKSTSNGSAEMLTSPRKG